MNDWQIGMQMMDRAPAPIPVIEGEEQPVIRDPANELQEMAVMHADGYSLRQIGDVFRRTPSYVMAALKRHGSYVPKRSENRTQMVIDMLKTGRRTSVDIASAISLDVKYVNQIIRRAEGVQRERVGVSNRYWIEK